MKNGRGLALLSALILSLAASGARAHPHVWIDQRAVLHIENDRLAAVEVTWVFDSLSSAWLIPRADLDEDGVLNDAESAGVKANSFDGLAASQWFSHLRTTAGAMNTPEPTDFHAAIEDGLVIFRFTLRPNEPITLHETRFRLAFYDSSFYIDFNWLDRNPVRIEGGDTCEIRLFEDESQTFYGGFLQAKALWVRCEN